MTLAFGIKVLGDFTVTRDGHVVPLPQSRKTRALLAYLAVAGKPQRREHLCELFWDVPDDPRGSLRWSLSKLRQCLEPDGVGRLVADRNFVQLTSPDVGLDYDLIRGLAPDSISGMSTDRLEAIAASFTGPFLADLDLPRCPLFEAWRTYCATDAEVLRLKVLRTLVDRFADQPERALPHVHALQSLLPDEDFGNEITSINERARLTVAARTTQEMRPAGPAPPTAETEPFRRAPEPASSSPGEQSQSGSQRIRYAVSRDGTRIAYAVSGSGPPIVRASHWMSHLEFDWESPVWGPWIESLSDGFTLVRYDSRLNGLSDQGAADLSLDAFVADLECVVEAAGLDRFALLGISQGCAFCVEYAIRHPGKVAGLMLYGGYARGWRVRNNPAEIARREAIAMLMREGWGQDDPVFRQIFTNLFIPGAGRVQMDWFNELQRRTLTPENALRLSGAFGNVDVSDRLGRLRTRTIVWHARSDRVAPLQEGRELAAGIAGARLSELDSQNHILLGDEPAFQLFVREVKSFAHEVLQSPASLAGDHRTRRLATILCVNFTSPAHSLEEEFPEVALELVDPPMMRAADIVRANGGTVLGIADTELMACFGAPDALEGHAALACRAALSIREALGEGSAVKVRMALDTGIVVVGPPRTGHRGELEVRGPPVTLAAEIGHALRGEPVVATERTRRAAGGFVTMARLAHRPLPRLAADPGLFEVRSLNRGLSRWHLRAERQLSPFIGRDMQLQVLNRAWREARDGDGQALFVVADPGLGKSRLTHEFVGAIPDHEAECLEAGALETDLKAGLVVVRRLLQGLFDVDGTEAPAAAAEKVARAQGERGFDRRLVDPVLAAMDLPVADPFWGALSAAERSRRLREAVVALLLSLAAAKPIVILVEDLHWMDAESEAVLARLGEAIQAGRILMILTCRPEYGRDAFSGAQSGEIRLSAFGAVETSELLDHLLGSDPDLGLVRERLSEACRGNVLFLEETVRSLADTGRLVGSPGRYRVSGDLGEIEATANINSIVGARLERLDAHARRLAEVASIFGGEIPAALLKRMAALPDERFDTALQSLKKADLLLEVQVFPESSLRFKHALIRKSISGRIVTADRVELHRRALAELEGYYSDRIEENAEQLARHAIEAQLWQEAVGHLLTSAWKAIRRSAHSSALDQLDSGIKLLAAHPEIGQRARSEIEFQLARGVALMAARGWGSSEVLAAFERAEALCEATGDDSRLFSTLRGRAQYYMISGRPAAAQELAERCAKLVEGTADPGLLIETDHMFWTNNFFLGDARAARTHAERTIGCYDAGRDHRLTYLYSGHDPGVCSRCFGGLAAWLAGDPDVARRHAAAAAGLAEELGHPLSMALAYWAQSHLHLLASQPEQALEWADRQLSLAERFQFPLLVGQALCQGGWARFWLGGQAAGLAQMEDGMDKIRATGAEMGLPYFIGLYAEALCEAGRLRDAGSAVAAAIRLGRQNGTLLQFSEVLGIEARIDERLGAAPAAVEKKLRRARAMAQTQHSAVAELRLATDLADRLRRQARFEEAMELVSPHADLIRRLAGFPAGEAARGFL